MDFRMLRSAWQVRLVPPRVGWNSHSSLCPSLCFTLSDGLKNHLGLQNGRRVGNERYRGGTENKQNAARATGLEGAHSVPRVHLHQRLRANPAAAAELRMGSHGMRTHLASLTIPPQLSQTDSRKPAFGNARLCNIVSWVLVYHIF
jgi:hypothetical protein